MMNKKWNEDDTSATKKKNKDERWSSIKFVIDKQNETASTRQPTTKCVNVANKFICVGENDRERGNRKNSHRQHKQHALDHINATVTDMIEYLLFLVCLLLCNKYHFSLCTPNRILYYCMRIFHTSPDDQNAFQTIYISIRYALHVISTNIVTHLNMTRHTSKFI